MLELNRVAIIIKPTQLMLNWIHSLGKEAYQGMTLEQLRAEPIVALLPEFDAEKEFDEHLQEIYIELFATELDLWEEDDDKWPADLSFKLFQSWFELERYQNVLDFGWMQEMDDLEDEFTDELEDEKVSSR